MAVPDPVLAVFAAGIGFLAMAVAEARVNAQPDAMARRNFAQLAQHIDRSGVDRDLQFFNPRQRRVVDQVSGKDDIVRMLMRIVPRRQRALDLAQRHRIDLHALLAHQAQNVDIGAGLLRKTHHVELAQLGNLAADNLRVVNPNRAAELGGQTQQVFCAQVGIGGVKRVWHKELRCCVCALSLFFTITPQRVRNKKYRFIASLCKNDMACAT